MSSDRIITGSIRVSSDEQKKKGQHVQGYREALISAGVPEDNIFEELARSGSMSEDSDMTFKYRDGKAIIELDLKKKRPDFDRWIVERVNKDLVEKHYINRWDRLARSYILQRWIVNYCRQHDVEFVATHDTNESKMIFITSFFAELESWLTKERIDFNKSFKFKHGLYMGTERKRGYKKSKIKIEGREFLHLIPYPKEKEMIDDIYNIDDYKSVCLKHVISPDLYYKIRGDRFYCGYISWKKQEKKGIHEPLVSEEQWKRVNQSS